jgi:hypothetical protein
MEITAQGKRLLGKVPLAYSLARNRIACPYPSDAR